MHNQLLLVSSYIFLDCFFIYIPWQPSTHSFQGQTEGLKLSGAIYSHKILLFLEKTLINCLYFTKQRKYSVLLSAKLHSFYLSSHCLKSSYPVCLLSQLSCIKNGFVILLIKHEYWHISLCVFLLYFVLNCNIKLLNCWVKNWIGIKVPCISNVMLYWLKDALHKPAFPCL